jgi:Phospholipase_D-nuclease N-terminal
MARVLLVLLAVGLAVYALVDLASSDEDERGGIPKWLWVVLIVLLPFVGAIAWILVRRSQRSAARYGAGGRPGRPWAARRRRSGPVAPDDDPEFLWRLEQEQRRQGRATGPDGGTAPDAGRATEDGTPETGAGSAGAGPADDDGPSPETDADGDQRGTNPGHDGPGSR